MDRVAHLAPHLSAATVRVAVIGAGYAGMAAAVILAARGVPVTVYESGALPGGRARRIAARGRGLDNGQHLLIGAYTELFRLMRQVGVPADAVLRLPLELRFADGFTLRARWPPGPLGLLAGLLAARGLPLGERLGAVRFMLAQRRRGFRLEEDCSVETLLARHAQDGRIAHYLWRPLCVSALNTPTAQASASVFLAVLRDTFAGEAQASDLIFTRVDLSRLFPEAAAAYVVAHGGTMRLSSPVRALGRDGPDLVVEGERYPRVVLACGPHQLGAFAATLPELAPLAATVQGYGMQPIYTCYLQYPEHVRLPGPLLGLAHGLVQWVFDRRLLAGGKGQLACVISAQGDHQQLTHEALAETCHRELAAALPGLPAPLWSQVIAEKRATIACNAGIRRVGPRTPLEGLFLAGDYTDPEYPPTLEAAVRSGVRAAGLAAGAN